MLDKMCAEESSNWNKYVERGQQIINNTPSRSTQNTPFQLMTGLIPMRTKKDLQLMQELSITEIQKERDEMRDEARKNISKLQAENKKTFDSKRVPAISYKVGYLVAIKGTHHGVGKKLRPKFLGPYKIVSKLNHDRYEILKVDEGEGSMRSTIVAEYMNAEYVKPSFGTKPAAECRMYT